MKVVKALAVSLAVLLGAAVATDVLAYGGGHGHGHGGHGHGGVRFGVWVGGPGYWGGYSPYYYPPYYSPYYYPRTVVVPGETVYVEQGQAAPAPAQSAPPPAQSYWYFCRDSNAYYPYVSQCAGQWERVSPRPPS